MEQNKKGFSQKNVFWIVIALAVLGQIAWGLENSWFNTFTYDEITTNTQPIAIMNGASAIVATVTTFLMGTLSDKAGKRKPFILWGYVIWGIATAGFYCCKLFPGEFTKCLMVVVLDCVMTFFFISVGALVSLTGLIAGNAMQDAPDLRPNTEVTGKGIWKQIFGSFKIATFKENKKLFLVLCIICILLCGFQVSYAYEMIFANQYLGISKTYATFLTAAALPIMVIASLWTGKLCDQGRGTKVLCFAPLLFIAGCLLHGSTMNIILIILARVLLYGGWMAMMVASTAMFKNLIPSDSHGRFEGMRMIFMVMIPMVVGPEIGSLLIGSGNVAPIIYIVSGIVAVLAYLPIFFLVQVEKNEIK